MLRGRKLGRRENRRRFKNDVAQVKAKFIPGKVFMRGGDPRF